jgi:hypothetical protein
MIAFNHRLTGVGYSQQLLAIANSAHTCAVSADPEAQWRIERAVQVQRGAVPA